MTTPPSEPVTDPDDDVPEIPKPKDPDAAPAAQPDDQPVQVDPGDLPDVPSARR